MLLTVDPVSEAADTSATASPTGVWLLDTSVEVTNGVSFEIKGTAIGGDCDEVCWCALKGAPWARICSHVAMFQTPGSFRLVCRVYSSSSGCPSFFRLAFFRWPFL